MTMRLPKIAERKPLAEWLARIRAGDADIRAWVEVNPRQGPDGGPLEGVPFGVKDIFETAGMATEYGSPIYAGRKGTRDAALVEHLLCRSAILLGKTHTAAFASFDPAPTRNPCAPGHTPGGSSSGSAAAVAAGMAAFSIGTQTLGSILRPAAYCGVCGFKPTFGRLPMEGVLPFAPSLDTAGLFTRTAEEMAWLWRQAFASPVVPPPLRGRLARFLVPGTETVAGVEADSLEPPRGWAELTEAAFLINEYEGARTHEARYRQFGPRMGAKLGTLIENGLRIPRPPYEAALAHVDAMRGAVAQVFEEYDAILTPAASGPPPRGLESTGDPSPNAPWTALGVPAISIPIQGRRLPEGLQVAAAWNLDDALVDLAAGIERSMI
jgi:Asp-tRNA(Asn)/Glu-tRNA(Gln) amidotransferase A subunit family amidase